MLKNRSRLTKEDQDTLVNIDEIYAQWRNEAIQEGDRATLESILLVKFETIDPPLKAIIPALLELSSIDRVRAVMQLSQEELIRDFGV